MILQQNIQQLEQLIQFEKIIVNSYYGMGLYHQSNNVYERSFKLKKELLTLRKLESRINKINKIKDKINEHKIQSLG